MARTEPSLWAELFRDVLNALVAFNLAQLKTIGAPNVELSGPDGRRVVAVNFMREPAEEYESIDEHAKRTTREFHERIKTRMAKGETCVYFDTDSVFFEEEQEVPAG